jgi:exodeoxyribonuclease-5
MFIQKKDLFSFRNLFEANFSFILTEDQQKLLDQIEVFISSDSPKNMQLISGYAGTGKTSFMGSFIKTLSQLKVKTMLLAPTGRAAKVLSKYSGKNAFTIHRIIYSTSNKIDGSFQMSLAKNSAKNTLFVIDESSMIPEFSIDNKGIIGRNLLEDLIEYVYSGENCKLIFIGDSGQLPPVGSLFSPALDQKYMTHHFNMLHVNHTHLTQVMRQTLESGILFNASKLRSDSSNIQLMLKNFTDIQKIDGLTLQEFLEHSYDTVGTEESILITRSNKRANEFNRQIRSRILWRDETLQSNDDLMIVKNNYYWAQKLKVGFLANGELIRVAKLKRRETIYGVDFLHATIDLLDQEESTMDVILFEESLFCEGPNIERERIKSLFFEIEKDYLHIKSKTTRYAEIMKNPYFNALQVKFSYAVTCHKSQGGQWKHVYIDFGYMTPEMIDNEYKRWLYTALTRSSEKVFLLNFPDFLFHSV